MLYVGIAILFCIALKHLLLIDDTVTVPYHFIITRKSFVEGSNLCPSEQPSSEWSKLWRT